MGLARILQSGPLKQVLVDAIVTLDPYYYHFVSWPNILVRSYRASNNVSPSPWLRRAWMHVCTTTCGSVVPGGRGYVVIHRTPLAQESTREMQELTYFRTSSSSPLFKVDHIVRLSRLNT